MGGDIINNLEIILSKEAYNEFKSLLEANKKDYSCVRMSYVNTCCNKAHIDIFLDDLENKTEYTSKNVDDILFLFDKNIIDNVEKIEFIYENSTIKIKTTFKATKATTCSKAASKGCLSKKGASSCNNCNCTHH